MRLLGSSESEATSYAFHPLHPAAPRHLSSVLWLPDSEAAPEASSRLERINWLAMGCLPKVMTIQKTVTQCKNTYYIYIYNNIYKRVVQWQPRFRTRFAGTSILWSQANRSRFDDQYKILNDAHGFHSTHLPKVSKAGVTPAKCRGDLVVCLVARCVECRNVCFQNNI